MSSAALLLLLLFPLLQVNFQGCARISDTSAKKIGRLVSLRALNLSGSLITDETLQALPRGLRHLHLRQLERITNDGIDSIIDLCTALEVRFVPNTGASTCSICLNTALHGGCH
jgi:hypothetical protein